MPYVLELTLNSDIPQAVLERAAHYNAVARGISQKAAGLPSNARDKAEEAARDYLAAAAGRECLASHVTVAAAAAGPGGAAYVEEEHRRLSGPLNSSIQVDRIRAVAVPPPARRGFDNRDSFSVVAPLSTSVGREAVERVARQRVLESEVGRSVEYNQDGMGLFGRIAAFAIQAITGEAPGTRRVTYDDDAVEAATAAAAWKITTDFVDSVAASEMVNPDEVALATLAEVSHAEARAAHDLEQAQLSVERDFAPGGHLSGLSPMEAYPLAFDL